MTTTITHYVSEGTISRTMPVGTYGRDWVAVRASDDAAALSLAAAYDAKRWDLGYQGDDGAILDFCDIVSDDSIRALRYESGLAGDEEQVAICDDALAGDEAAITECMRVIDAARAMDDGE